MPSLDKLQLEAALLRLQDVPISRAAKQTIADILKAASNPDAESLPVVLATLEPNRRRNVDKTTARVGKVTKGITARARAALMDMDDAEWARLVEESDNG